MVWLLAMPRPVPPPPQPLLQDLFELVHQHFAARAAISSIDQQLEQQEVTFRSIQKRLLARYKVRCDSNHAEGGLRVQCIGVGQGPREP